MIPWPTVFATAVVAKAPARFATEATSTAARGESARVETEVATAFAVSWKPFVKSNASAATIDEDEEGEPHCAGLPVLDDDRLKHVRRVLAASRPPDSSRSWMSFQRMIEMAS